jgi:thiosulfate/3-mercaptopyruvate sulfurtransferase
MRAIPVRYPRRAGGKETVADSLTDVTALAQALAGPRPPVLLDVRWRLPGAGVKAPYGLDSYRAGHLPGARFVDLDRDLAGPPGPGGRHPLPAADRFQAAMRRAGVRDGWPAVVYDEADSTAAARAWWLLRYFGHDQVQVLDGGYQAWLAAGQPVETGPGPADAPGGAPDGFTARPGGLPLLGAAAAAAVARDSVLLDARAAERYQGAVEPADPVAGHIPGAISAPTTANVTAAGKFLDPAALRTRFAELGVPVPSAPGEASAPGQASAPLAGVYCGSGVTAAHEVLAMDIAGLPAALYLGSWSDWITDPARPVATGPDPG